MIKTVGDVVQARRLQDSYEAAKAADAHRIAQERDQAIQQALAADPSLGLLVRNGKPVLYRFVDGHEQIVDLA